MRKIYSVIFNGSAFKSKSPKWILGLFVVLLGMAPHLISAQSISVSSVTATPVCAGSDVTVTFDATNGGAGLHYDNSTSYVIYLSNASGTSFKNIGTFTSSGVSYNTNDNQPTTINQIVTIPSTTVTGSDYKISIGSTSPLFDASGGVGASGAFTINAQVTPTVSIASDDPDNNVCSGTPVTFTATPTNGGSPSYQWYIGASAVGSNSATFTTSSLNNGDVVKVVMTSTANCATPTTATSNTITMTVNTTVVPSVTISTPGTSICSGASTTFTAANPTNGGTNPTYQWQISTNGGTSFSDINLATNNTYTTSSIADGDIIRLQLNSNAACASPNPVNSNELTISITPDATISLTSAAGTNNQTKCINTAITPITYSIGGGGTGAGVTGLPTGVTGNYSGGVFTISGTPTVSGTFNYTVTTTGSCVQATATGTITVNPDATISLTSAAGTNNQTKCINTAITPITYSIGGGGTGAGVTGLPTGVTGNYSGGVFTISGTPTVSGTFNYTVTTTGSCVQTTATGTITVNPDATISLTSAAGTNNQTKCINTAITPITYSIGGGGTGAGVTGLPTGVTGNYSGGVFTISGTPTVSGTFNYTVTTTGSCVQATATGTITVNPDATISLTSAAGTNNQTKCINTAITPITYSIGGGGTGAGVTGLPTGVTGNYSGGVFTISGTPTVSGTFNYTVTTTGSCVQTTATGTITVNPDATISLTSAAGTNNQTKCINTAITPITYSIGGGGTGAGVTGLPTGVTGNYSGGVFTISGTPTVSGTFNYTVTTTGSCVQATATGTITVNPDATISLTSAAGTNNQTKCINTAITAIKYNIGGGGTGAGVTGLPTGVTGSYSGGVFTISGTPTVSGTFNYTVTTTGSCVQNSANGTITVTPDATLSLTSASATTSQNVCRGTSIASITYTISGTSGYTVTGLPPGVSASINSGVITISGTPNNSIGSTNNYNYTITTSGTCNNVTLAGNIKVWVGSPSASWNGNPVIISPSGSICPPAILQFSVSAATNVQYYKWTLPSGWVIDTGDSTNSITVDVTSAASIGRQTVSVMAVNPCGNVSASTKNNDLNVNSFTGVTVSPSTQSVCSPNSITVVGTLTGNAVSGTWSAPSGTFSNVVTSSTSPVTVTATYTPTITSGNVNLTITTNTPTGCSHIAGQAVVALAVNQPSVAPTSESASTATICSGSSTTLTQNGGSLGTGASWKWYSNSSYTTLVGTSTAADGSLTVSPTSTTTYYVRAESSTGAPCTANVAGAGSVTVTVNQPSTAPVSLAASTATICSGSNTNLTQSGGSLGTGASWKWYSNASYTTLVGSGSGSNASLSVSPTSTTTYYLQIEGGTAPCATTLQGPAAGVTVTVNQPSVAPTSESASTAVICSGSSTTLTQNGGSLGTGASWKWYSNSSYTTLVGTSTATDGSLTVSPTSTTTYYVRAESSTGAPCTANVAGAGSVTVTVNQPSTAPVSLAASTATICSGSNTNLTQSGGSLGTGASWKWYSDASYTTLVGSGSGSNASLSVSPTSTTTYYLQIEGGTAPCATTLQGPAAGVTVTVNQPSVAPTSESASTAVICSGSSTTLTQNGGSLGTGASWKWYSNSSYTTLVGTSTATDGSLTVSPTSTTTYYVRAESSTGAPCTANVAGAGSVTVTVNQPSTAPVSLAASTATICSGSNTNLTQSGGSLGTGASWKWYSDASYTTLVGSGSGSNASLSVSPTSTTTYYLQIEGGTAPCATTLQGPAAGVTVTVNQPSVAPTSESASTATICSGSSTTLTQNGGSLGTGASWKWYSNSSYTTLVGTSTAADGSLTVSPTSTTTYYVRAESSTGAPCTANVAGAGSVTVTVHEPVVINTQPQNFGTCASNPAQLGVVASGDGLVYQWYKGNIGSGTVVTNTSNISGATSNILKFAQVDLSDAGAYYVVITGAAPCSSVTSNQVTLNVDKSITFTTQPQSQTVCVNATSVTFNVSAEANGDALTYQWRKNGNAIGGANGFSYTINNVSLTDAGDYDVLVTGPSGYTCSNAYSAKATLAVNDQPSIGTQPTGATYCEDGTASGLTVSATGTGTLTYQWYSNSNNSNSGGTSLGSSNGANTASYTPPTTTAGTTYYYVVAGSDCGNATSDVVAVTVNPSTAIGTQPTGATYCQNGTASALTVSASGTGTLSYQWYSNSNNSNSGGTSLGSSNGANTSSYTPPTTTAGTIYYYVVAGSDCGEATSNAVAVTVNPSTAIGTQPTGATYCQDGTATALTVSATGTGTLTYQWYSNTTNSNSGGTSLGSSNGANTASYTPPTSTAGTTYYYVVAGSDCGNATSDAVAVTVNPSTTIGTQPTGATYCQDGTATALTVSATGTGTLTYQWYSNTTNSNSGGSSLGSSNGANTASYTPPTSTAGTTYYYVVAGSDCGNATSDAVAVTVNPSTTIGTQPTGATYCQDGTATALTVSATGTGTLTYQWYSNTTNSNSGGTSLGSSNGANTASYTPPTSTAGTTYYYVVAGSDCGNATSDAVAVTVNPSTTIGTQPTGATYCQDGTATALTVSATGTGTLTYQWYSNTTNSNSGGSSLGSSNGANTASYTPPTSTAGTTYYYVVVTGTCGSSSSNPVAVNVDETPVAGSIAITASSNPSSDPAYQSMLCEVTSTHPSNSATFTISGASGTVTWEQLTNGSTWIPASGTTNANSFTVSNLSQTTLYRAKIVNGACGTPVYSNIIPLQWIQALPPTNPKATPPTICLGESSTLTADTGFPPTGITADQGDFNNGASDNKTWTVYKPNGSIDGNALNAGGDNSKGGWWAETNGPQPIDANGITYNSPDHKFAITSGAYNPTILESPVFSLIGVTSNLFSFSQAYNLTSGAVAKIEISTNGGSSYTTLETYTGPATFGNMSGSTNNVKNYNIDLTNYLGMSNLRIRFKFQGNATSAWALDNLNTPGAVLPISYSWSGTILNSSTGIPVVATPQVTGTSYYTLQTTIAGCPGGQVQVPVVVNPLPTYGTVKQGPAVCSGTNATFNLTNLTPNVVSTIVYNINGGASNTTTAAADGSGNGSFTVPVVIGNNGQTLTITSITNNSSANAVACSVAPNISTTISVNPVPTATVSGTTTLCQNSTSPSITFAGAAGPAPYTFTYTVNGGSPLTVGSNPGTVSVPTSTAGTFTYSLVSVQDGNGCSNNQTATATVTINAQATVTTPPADQLACPEGAISFTVVATSTPAPTYSWEVSTDNGATWNPASGADYTGTTTNTLNVLNITAGNTKDGFLFRSNVIASAACPVTSGAGKLTIHNIWHGYTNTDWYTTSNWSDGALPTLSCDSVIILNVTKLPTVNGGGPDGTGAYTNHLVIRPDATVTVVDDTLHIAAGIWDNNMALDATQGTIDLNGNIDYVHGGLRPAQSIAGKMFNTPYGNNSGRIMNLQISNPKGVTVLGPTENDTLNILHTLSFGNVNGVTLSTGDNITLISDANGTARLADMTNNGKNSGNAIDGQVEVERFIRTANNSSGHDKAWEFVAIANKGQSIFDSWMEKGNNASTGYGTRIAGNVPGTDASALQPSMKFLGPSGDLMDWTGISNTADQIYNPEGYMIFVRGDRSVNPFTNPTSNPTRLRTKGTLLTDDLTINLAGITGFGSVGNPYAAQIDMRKVMPLRTMGTVGNSFYTWKSPAWGTYGYGVYVIYTENGDGDYEPTPFGVGDAVNNNIESGQAFILQSVGGPASISFKETVKASAYSYNNTVFRGSSVKGVWQQLRTNLYVVAGGKTTIADGTLIHFDDKFSNKVDINDSRKIFNPGPSLSTREAGTDLIVESRGMPSTDDTIHMQLTNAPAQNYRLVFATQHLGSSGLQGYLEDHFLNTLTPINMEDTTVYNFAIINSAASKAADRFDIVFRKAIVPPPAITTFTATVNGRDVTTAWDVVNEEKVKQYDVERSVDGYNFIAKTTVSATNSATASYTWTDVNLLPGYYYYRIRMSDAQGKVTYTQPVKVLIGTGKPSIAVYPNPVTNGIIHLQFLNEPAGKYAIRLMNQLGQVIVSKQIERMNGSDSQTIQWDYNLAHGIYQLEIMRPDGSVKIIKVIY